VVPWRSPANVVPLRFSVMVLAVTADDLLLNTRSVAAVPERVVQLDLICAISSGSLHCSEVRPKCWPLSHNMVVMFLARA
jgi:hypothetical protein